MAFDAPTTETKYVFDSAAFAKSMQLAQEHAERMWLSPSITDDRVLKRIENGHTTLLKELRKGDTDLWS